MTTRLGFGIILAGVVLLILRAVNLVDTEVADIASVLAIVVGALAVAVDGESADRSGPEDGPLAGPPRPRSGIR